jgi:hypothetical protein
VRYAAPFFPLMGRAAVFWVGAATFAALGFLLLGLSQPDEIISPYVDASFLATFAIPALAGWLAGAIIQEFQGCTFAWALPAASRRVAAGYLSTGAVLSLLIGGMVGASHPVGHRLRRLLLRR